MSDHPPQDDPPDDPQGSQPRPTDDSGGFTQHVRHQQLSARVPERIAPGVFASGVLILNGNHEFVLDFLQAVARPHQLAARVVLPPPVAGHMAGALRKNIDLYTQRFGAPPPPPTPQRKGEPPPKPPPIEEIYDQLKISEDVAGGVYANTVMITHASTEFCLDFITSFYPRSTVTCRVYLSAQQGPRLLKMLTQSIEQFNRKLGEQRRDPEQPPGNDDDDPQPPPEGEDRPGPSAPPA